MVARRSGTCISAGWLRAAGLWGFRFLSNSTFPREGPIGYNESLWV